MISPAQIRAARGFVNLNKAELADAANITIPTITAAEHSGNVNMSSLNKLEAFFKTRGVEFDGLDTVRFSKAASEVSV